MPSPSRLKSSRTFSSPELAAVPEAICHEVHRPDLVRRLRYGQLVGLLPLQTLARLDPQVQLQIAVDPVDALVVPAMSLDIAQVQKAQAEALGLLRLRQPEQQVSDLLVLIVQFGAVSIAGLADVECPTSQRDADALLPHTYELTPDLRFRGLFGLWGVSRWELQASFWQWCRVVRMASGTGRRS